MSLTCQKMKCQMYVAAKGYKITRIVFVVGKCAIQSEWPFIYIIKD